MTYRHAIVRTSHEDLASGAVLHSAPRFPAFPVRLASEIFQRALALRGGRPARRALGPVLRQRLPADRAGVAAPAPDRCGAGLRPRS
ncbi:hypothetical protein ACFSTC_28350 [Nonomuraea ferruginea]